MRYRIWIALGFLLRRLPLRVSYAVADGIGSLAFTFWRTGRQNLLANYAVVLPDAAAKQRRQVARRSLQNYCRYLVDFMRLPESPEEAIALVADTSGAYTRLRGEMAGRGAMVVSDPLATLNTSCLMPGTVAAR